MITELAPSKVQTNSTPRLKPYNSVIWMPVRVLTNRGFARAARKEGLTDQALCAAAAEIESGLIDARLGSSSLKKRIAKGSRGKSGEFRTILAYRRHDRLVFLHVFGKNDRDNITGQERLAHSGSATST